MALSHVIRPAIESDLPGVLALERKWARSGETLGFQATDESLLRSAIGGCFFVAEAEAGPLGFVWGRLGSEPKYTAVVPAGEAYLELEDLYVVAEARGKGIGRELLDASLAWGRGRARYVVGFTSTIELDRVLRFYGRSGLRPWGVQLVLDLTQDTPRGVVPGAATGA